MAWQQAIDWCASLGDGWRLPTVRELSSIVDYARRDPAAVEPLKASTASYFYWSSTTNAYFPYNAWVVNFFSGSVYDFSKTNDNYVRAVRGGAAL